MMENKILLDENRIVGAHISVNFYKGKKEIVARSHCLRITACGKNLEDAKAEFKQALSLWIDTVNADGDAEDVLENLGYKI